MWAPEAVALLAGRAERLVANRSAAASAWLTITIEDVGGTPWSQVASGGLAGSPAVGQQQLLGALNETAQVLDLAHRRPRMKPLEEEDFSAVERPDTGQVALIQQRLPDCPIRFSRNPADHLGQIPVWAKQIGTEMADNLRLVRGGNQLHHWQPVAHGSMFTGGEDGPDLVLRVARPTTACEDAPRAIHPEVRMQRHLVVEPEQLVLSPGGHLPHCYSSQVGRGQRRYSELAAGQLAAGEHVMQATARPPDRIPFGHIAIVQLWQVS